jgi:hypothetical protein
MRQVAEVAQAEAVPMDLHSKAAKVAEEQTMLFVQVILALADALE